VNIYDFWSRVKTRIKGKSVTQDEAARACGINPHTFRGWMSTGKVPPLNYAYSLARYLDVSLEYLISGSKSGPASQTKGEVMTLLKKAEEKLSGIRCNDA